MTKSYKKTLVALTSTVLLVGCHTSSPRVVLPSTPPLSADILEQTAGSCEKETERLRSRSAYVPDERKKEYNAVMDLAEKNCKEIVETLTRLKAATHQEQSFRQNIQHAESTMLPGTVVSEPSSSSSTVSDSVNSSGEISAEPLN